MKYNINYANLGGTLPLPLKIRDYLKECGGDYIKILIFILGSDSTPTVSEIAECLTVNANTVNDGIKYWASKGFIDISAPQKSSVAVKPTPSQITTDELIYAKQNYKDADLLFKQAELLYNRPLKPSERRNLLFILDTTGLGVDVILMAIDYCIKINKYSSRYILKVCENWDDLDITTHEKAEKHIKFLLEKNEYERLVCNTFGIHNRKLSSNESKSIEKWRTEYGYSIDIVEEAFNKCVDNTGKLSFPYINKILSKWYRNGVDSLEKVDALDIEYKKSKNDSDTDDETSYDIEEFERRGYFVKE